MPGLQHTVTIVAPPERVWEMIVDVERWPERIPTVDAVERLDDGPLAVGSRTRLRQPKLPTAVWTVTELSDGSSYTWESRSPGVTVKAAHIVEPHPDGSRFTLGLTVSGPMSGIGWLLTRSLTKQLRLWTTDGPVPHRGRTMLQPTRTVPRPGHPLRRTQCLPPGRTCRTVPRRTGGARGGQLPGGGVEGGEPSGPPQPPRGPNA
jgi:uncharacterized protein YndB with AHSA1/START domain